MLCVINETLIVRGAGVREIVDLRHRILRAGLPRESAHFEGDEEPQTRHFAAILEGRIVGCATVLRRDWEGRPAWQLRGMAVEDGCRGMGVGTELLRAAEYHVLTEGGTSRLWCNAREPAVRFYERNGWQVVSERFEISTAGPHFRMTRRAGE